MKVLLAVHHFPPRFTGGAEWQAYRIATVLQARGHSVRVVCVERVDSGPAAGVEWHDDAFEGVSVRRLSFNWRHMPDPGVYEYNNAWIGDHLRDWLTRERPDVFHLVSGYLLSGAALQAAYHLCLPAVVSVMDFWFLCRRISMLRSNGQLSRLPITARQCAQCLGEERRSLRWLGHWLPDLMKAYWDRQTKAIARAGARQQYLFEVLNGASKIISNSQFLRRMLIQSGIEPDKVVFIRQGLDRSPSSAVAMEKSPSPQVRLAYLGQIAELKGIHVLIQAVRQIPDERLHLKIYGDVVRFPRYTAQLQKLIGKDPRIEFAGTYQGSDELPRILRDIEVVGVPSLWYENSPNVILEAFAHRTPVLVSDLGGMAELCEDGVNGLRFAPGDAADLARCLRRLLEEPELLSRLQAGIRPVKRVDEEVDELEALYEQVRKESKRTPDGTVARPINPS